MGRVACKEDCALAQCPWLCKMHSTALMQDPFGKGKSCLEGASIRLGSWMAVVSLQGTLLTPSSSGCN